MGGSYLLCRWGGLCWLSALGPRTSYFKVHGTQRTLSIQTYTYIHIYVYIHRERERGALAQLVTPELTRLAKKSIMRGQTSFYVPSLVDLPDRGPNRILYKSTPTAGVRLDWGILHTFEAGIRYPEALVWGLWLSCLRIAVGPLESLKPVREFPKIRGPTRDTN